MFLHNYITSHFEKTPKKIMLETFQMSFCAFFFSIVAVSSFINDIFVSESLMRVATLPLNRSRRTVATGAISEKLVCL